MFRQRFEIDGREVDVFYAVTRYNMELILDALEGIGCSGENLHKAEVNIMRNTRNNGITYSNYAMRRGVVVIGYCDKAEQYFDSVVHEIAHLAEDICVEKDTSPTGEQYAYLAGEIARRMYPRIKSLVCPECLTKTRSFARSFAI